MLQVKKENDFVQRIYVFKKKMQQTGDPTGTGKGGNSIWGRKFNDEIRSVLKV